MKASFFVALMLSISVPASAAVYTTKPEAKFYVEPHGDTINIKQPLIMTPPLERKDSWCFFKLVDGRGAALNPPAGWTKCASLDKFVGV